MVDQSEVRKAVVEADNDKNLANLVFLELLAVAVAVGYFESSWGLGIGTYVVLLIVFMIPYVRVLAYLAASLCWALLVLRLVDGPAAFRSGSAAVSDAGVFLALFALIVSLIGHFAFRRHMADFAPAKAKAQQEAATASSEVQEQVAALSSDERECPICAETIKAKAKKCRYCGSEVEPVSAIQPSDSQHPIEQLHLMDAVPGSASTPRSTLASPSTSHNEVQSPPAEPLKVSMAENMRLRRERRKKNHPVLWRLMQITAWGFLLSMWFIILVRVSTR